MMHKKSTINFVFRLTAGMQVFVKTLTSKTITIKVKTSDTIENMKQKIRVKTGLSPDNQKLEYQGQILEDYKSVYGSQILEKSTLHLVASLHG